MIRSFISCVTMVVSLVLVGCSKKDDSSGTVTPPTSTTAAVSSLAIVTTLAGNGDEGYVDTLGAAARFKNQVSIVCDKNDNIYVVDLNNSRIRLVSPTGSVTTLAGSETVGVADDVGTNAKFYLTSSAHVIRDVAGNLLLTENTPTGTDIRKITPMGVLSSLHSVSLGVGMPLGFYSLVGAANDDVYISDGSTIQLLHNGVLSIYAGGTRGYANDTLSAAQFNNPNGLTFDTAGNLYVGDDNTGIRKITSAGGVSLLAGQSGVTGTADGKGTAATFQNINSLVADKQGNLYVADNTLIRRVAPDGTATTIVGSGTGYTDGTGTAARFRDAHSITTDSKGALYVTDLSNQVIRKIVIT